MSPPALTPPRWPSEILYTNTQKYHSSVTEDVRLQLRNSAQQLAKSQRSSGVRREQRSPVIIMRIKDEHHPANGQCGLFAAKKLPPRSHIIDYVGEVHCDERVESDYDLSLLRMQDGLNVGVDATKMGNEARFINDFRGITERPNVYFCESLDQTGKMCMSVWSGPDVIKKGDELLVSYGKGFWKARKPE
ncbi:hypothetical protein BDY19DRAFT_1080197 [Irpex rosettiformis]|uniref:Uncharacterized protein n=1 Tax=Irpex rosettiformis TaxID=378272 RepID=A0ACB8UJJ4_9APHY|nr:hypothetical protein BDY19DRAFT_1080197 [Irpex rosettiformis]